MKKVSVVVKSSKDLYVLPFLIRKSEKISDQRIEEGFYVKWSKLFDGVHYEMQVLSKYLLFSAMYKLGKQNPSKLHIHPSEKVPGEHYVCWTGHVQTEEEAMELLKFWSVGTVYTMEHNEDFVRIFENEGVESSDYIKFFDVLSKKYGIEFAEYKQD